RAYVRTYSSAKSMSALELEGGVGAAINSIICHGLIVSGGCVRNSILSPEVRINSYSQVDECILMNGVDVGRHSKLRRVIVDKYVRIPPGIEIGYNPEEDRRRFTVTEAGVVVIARNACSWDENSRPGYLAGLTTPG